MSKRFEFVRGAPQRSPAWFALRKQGITATDVSVISGLSPYKSPFRLWAEKTGRVEDQPVGEAAHRGILLEDTVGRYYEGERGVKLRKSNGVVRLKNAPWAMASLDRTIVGEPDGIVELKTSASRAWDIQPIPGFVLAQVHWQLLITGAKWCDVAVLLGGLIFRIERVMSDQAYQSELFAKAEAFRELIASDTPPPMTGQDSPTFEELTPQRNSVLGTASRELNRIAKRYADAQYEIKLLDEEIATYAIAIKEEIAEREGIIGDGWVATWKQNKPSRKTDWKLLVAEEGITEDTVNAYTQENLGARVFRLKLKEDGE